MSNIAPIPLVPEQCAVLRHCRDAFCKAVETKFGCTTIFHNLEDSDSDSSGSNASKLSAPELKYFKQLSKGVKVSVWRDDLTRHKVDAVVNAANEGLHHGAGLALALSKAGGPVIQKCSDDIIRKQGNVPTGTAVVTAAGYLPCKNIIHAVGPCLPSNITQWHVDKSAPILQKTIKCILDVVEFKKFSSVAIPAISSGLFNFPRDLCANIIVQTVQQYNDNDAFNGRAVEINLVNNDEPTVQEMERACTEFLGPPNITGSYSGAVTGRDQSFSSGNSFQFGNVTLHLRKGLIEEQKVDVIVNTISDTLDLSMGLISEAILKKAGEKIQEELYKFKKDYPASCDVFVTKGHNLNCAAVYHCTLKSGTGAKTILYKVVFDCLMKAVSAYKSISFPAIGTGNLRICKQDVAEIMMNAVAEFAKQNSRKKLDINFVVFPKDVKMMQAFENKLNNVKARMKFSEFPSTTTQSSTFATKESTRNETPTLEISSVSKEALREAQAWIMNMLGPRNDTITIMNNHVIYFGQKDHENLLSLQTMFGVKIAVFFKNGNGGIFITGEPISVSCVAIEVESMLCQAQNDFALDEESDLLYSVVRWQCKGAPWPPKINAALEKAYLARNKEIELHDYNIRVNLKNMYVVDVYGKTSGVERTCMFKDYNPLHLDSNSFYARTPVDRKDYMEMERKVKDCGLNAIRVEKIENAALQPIFELNRKRIKDKPEHLYQCVSAQFCDLICRVGFHKDFAPPAEQKNGSGIYFSSRLDRALKLWNRQKEEYIYIIQAQVLTGKSAIGSPDFILPPVIGSDPLKRFDSVTDKENTRVIFNGQQALPQYLIICGKQTSSAV
ncbi:hypothetical protein IRJ41_016525 [Triplophysa rosa]|uniref:Macro domain-containing protein n=2 Tax=Triplophysa rosa TaxID=992332 RepID=A0A9W7WV99_TRIRA|nr:hypothetical protein IRJ41_016525 [Triplophysa rosa]